ncbi:proteinase T-like [Acanthaster planci]|uniref:Proteinase T-like n=1 Tax=Acanthaster planci TaxID=133434 RepID=A0A8B7YVI9_ACAPL|nr:proteinase T-like [Acanthaster planci]
MKLLLLCLCVALAHASLAPLRTTNERAVPDSWIIKVEDFDQLERVQQEIEEIFYKFRTPTPQIEKLENLMPVLTLKVPQHILSEVRAIEGVEYVHEDTIATIFGTQNNPPWGLDRIDSRSGRDNRYRYKDSAQGANVRLFIVDTGINTNHQAFGGRASLLYGGADDQGHGTHCAGTAGGNTYGIARKAKLYSSKVCNSQGQCSNSLISAGLDAIVKKYGSGNGKGVVSMSLGGGYSSYMNSLAQNMLNKGYTVSVAAGNSNIDACNSSPAAVKGVITVAASDKNDKRAYFSNYGSCVDLFAPGVDVKSASHSSNSGSRTLSGTSMACPHVSGAAAVYLGTRPGSSPSAVHNAIVNNASTGKISDTKGSPNRLLYVQP